MKIRRAEAADAAAVAALAEQTFRDAFGAQNSPEDMDIHCRATFGQALQLEEIADPQTLTVVAESEGRLVGYGQLRRYSIAPCVRAARPAEILRLYVDREWHGSGVGQRLMSALLEAARESGADAVWLGVWEHNPRAIAFYAKHGFRAVGEQTFVLGRDPQRDLVMEHVLVA